MTEAEEARAFLEAQGYELRLRRQDRHAKFIARGEPGHASFFAEGREYVCLDLVSAGEVAWAEFAVGATDDDALVNAWHRYTR